MTLNISAIDPSMTSTGLANVQLDRMDVEWSTALVKSVACGDQYAALKQRFARMADKVLWQFDQWGTPTLIVMEGPSMQSKGRQHTMAGQWWKFYDVLSDIAPVLIVPPTNRIIYATGNGTSGKDVVMLATSRRYPDAPIMNNDQGDAVVLAAMGARVMNRPIDTLPKTHLRALDKIDVSGVVPEPVSVQ